MPALDLEIMNYVVRFSVAMFDFPLKKGSKLKRTASVCCAILISKAFGSFVRANLEPRREARYFLEFGRSS